MITWHSPCDLVSSGHITSQCHRNESHSVTSQCDSDITWHYYVTVMSHDRNGTIYVIVVSQSRNVFVTNFRDTPTLEISPPKHSTLANGSAPSELAYGRKKKHGRASNQWQHSPPHPKSRTCGRWSSWRGYWIAGSLQGRNEHALRRGTNTAEQNRRFY